MISSSSLTIVSVRTRLGRDWDMKGQVGKGTVGGVRGSCDGAWRLTLVTPRYGVAKGVVDVHLTGPKLTVSFGSRSQMRSRQKAKYPSRDLGALSAKWQTLRLRGLQYHIWGKGDPDALDIFFERQNQEGCQHPTCTDNSQVRSSIQDDALPSTERYVGTLGQILATTHGFLDPRPPHGF